MKLTKSQVHIGAPGYRIDGAKLPDRLGFTLTKGMVLQAVAKAISPDSTYINEQVQRMHADHISAGGKGFSPRTDLVLARLNALASDGLLIKSRFPNGYYGYRWTITPAGRAALNGGAEK